MVMPLGRLKLSFWHFSYHSMIFSSTDSVMAHSDYPGFPKWESGVMHTSGYSSIPA